MHPFYRYCKLKMENLKFCWMLRTAVPILFILLLFLNFCIAGLTQAAPTQHTTTTAAEYILDITTLTEESAGVTFLEQPPPVYDPTKPKTLSFIKVDMHFLACSACLQTKH